MNNNTVEIAAYTCLRLKNTTFIQEQSIITHFYITLNYVNTIIYAYVIHAIFNILAVIRICEYLNMLNIPKTFRRK